MGGSGGRPFTVVALGDSVMWGQGLRPENKLAALVQAGLQHRIGRQVDLHVFAHSGATIAEVEGEEGIDQPWRDDPLRPLRPGELPYSDPTVLTQVDLAAARLDARSVDLEGRARRTVDR